MQLYFSTDVFCLLFGVMFAGKKKGTVIKFIPNTDKRYSITDGGIVISNYKYNKQGKKAFHRIEICRYFNNNKNKTLVVNLQLGKHSDANKPKTFYLNTLMEKCFSLSPPDKFHFYDLCFKDGNPFNSSLNNLEYRIRTNELSNYKFYPQPFYNLSGKITHKTCAICGNKKEIKFFNLQKPKENGQNKTYRNQCEHCRYTRQWKTISDDIDKLKRHRDNTKKWAESSKGKKYFKEYHKKSGKYERENLLPHYLAASLRMNVKDLTPELISLSRKRILLTRKIKRTAK